MQQIRTAQDIKKLGTILSVWAHPDDESFTAAGILRAAAANGQKVVCITATRGEAGVRDETRWPAAKLGQIREKELKTALRHLGVKEQYFLDYIDGHCREIPESEAAAQIKKFVDKYQPDTILTFGPEGMTGHSDHKTVSHWVDAATAGTNIKVYHAVEEAKRYNNFMKPMDEQFDIYFNIDRPPICKAADCAIAFELPKDILAKKCSALKSMPSQTEAMFKQTPKPTMDAMLGNEYFVLAY